MLLVSFCLYLNSTTYATTELDCFAAFTNSSKPSESNGIFPERFALDTDVVMPRKNQFPWVLIILTFAEVLEIDP